MNEIPSGYDSDRMLALIEKGRQQGYITVEELTGSLPELLEPEAIEEALAIFEQEGIPVLLGSEAAERELRLLAEEADRAIEQMESETLDDPVQWWVRQATRAPRLTPDEEQELARQAREGDETARERLIESNLRLVLSIARHYTGRGLPLADLIQEGTLGLMRAVNLFRPEKGTPFATFAAWWIRHQIGRALQVQAATVRLPEHLMKALRRVRQTTALLQQQLGRQPTLHEIARHAGMSVEQVSNLLNAVARPISLETPVGGGGEEATLLDLIAEEPPPIEEGFNLEPLLGVLNEKERTVIELRYGLGGAQPLTISEIGRALNLSRERVRQLEARAIEKMRKAAGL